MKTCYAILSPRVRWTEAERPDPTLVIQSRDDGETWRVIASCDDPVDADDVCAALQHLSDERHAERTAGREQLAEWLDGLERAGAQTADGSR